MHGDVSRDVERLGVRVGERAEHRHEDDDHRQQPGDRRPPHAPTQRFVQRAQERRRHRAEQTGDEHRAHHPQEQRGDDQA